MPATPPEGPSGDAPEGTNLTCPSCGARYEPLQEYCLDCGARLPTEQGLAAESRAAIQRRFAWAPDWIFPALIGLLVAVLATGAVIALGGGDEGSGANTFVATDAPSAGRIPSTEPTITPPEPTTPAPTTGATPRRPAPRRLIAWPAGRNGYTVVLFSIPKTTDGRRTAFEKARAALAAGLRQVGVLDSSEFSSLHPGYYVVFSGIYGSQAAAEGGREAAEANGYPPAYVRPISR